MAFRISAKNLFLTYPKCPIQPQEAALLIKEIFKRSSIVYLQIAQETHQDLSLHLHVLICLEQKKATTSAVFADLHIKNTNGEIVSYHGNYQSARNPLDVKKYLDKNPVSMFVEGVIEDICLPGAPPKEKLNARITRKLRDGKTVNNLLVKARYQPYLLTNLAKVNFFSVHLSNASGKEVVQLPEPNWNANTEEAIVLRWIALNCFNEYRPLRTKNLFIQGLPGCGKTTLVQTLAKSFKTYFVCLGEKYFDGLTDDHELIVFDEFCGTTPLGIMNQILDGQECLLPQRYQVFRRRKNTPIIILSNLFPQDCYKKTNEIRLEAFISRLTVLYITNFLKIFKHQ